MVTKMLILLVLMGVSFPGTGQLLEFRSVKKLPSSVNSVGEEILPLLSPDGSQLFFARALYAGNVGGKFSGLDVWISEGGSGSWTKSRNTLPAGINDQGHNTVIGTSPDGNKIYFMSAAADEKINGIYATSRINNYWTRPVLVPVPGIDNQNFLGVFVSSDFQVMLLSMKAPDSNGEEDLYFSVKNSLGQWSTPRNMGPTINTKGFEISPFLSADNKRLYFASNGHGGEGDADIFYSDRLYNSWETWSLPVNLGNEVNSKKFDAYLAVYGDSIAYFASNRDGKFADIFEVKVTDVKTVLAPGQRYFTREEWNRQLGDKVSNEIVFPSRSSDLSALQRELLFYIANKLQLQKGIRFHLVVKEEESSELTQARLKVIVDHLVQSGIDDQRIITDQVEPIVKSNDGKIEIRLVE